MENAAFIASMVSLILGIYAIWLSIVFYRMSNSNSRDIQVANRQIAANVERVERFFDRFYNSTFSALQETYSDMRRQL